MLGIEHIRRWDARSSSLSKFTIFISNFNTPIDDNDYNNDDDDDDDDYNNNDDDDDDDKSMYDDVVSDDDNSNEIIDLTIDDDDEDEDNDNNQCSICINNIEPDSVEYLPCAHGFHRDCITRWLEIKHYCPICKNNVD